MKIFWNLNPKNKKNYTTRKFYRSQINLVKMSYEDLRVINEECNFQNVNEVKLNENESEMKC